MKDRIEHIERPRQGGKTLDTIEAERDFWKQRAAQLDHDLEQQRTIIDRVTGRMTEYDRHGSGTVNVRQVLNLLSPTWPDGNYCAPEVTG